MAQSLIVALYYQNIGTPDVLGRTHGHSPYDNRTTTYTMGTPAVPSPALIPLVQALIAGSNQSVTRYDITPDAQNYLERNYVPTGNLSIPVVSVHNLWDYLVPSFHEPAFAGFVSAAGASEHASTAHRTELRALQLLDAGSRELVPDSQQLGDDRDQAGELSEPCRTQRLRTPCKRAASFLF